MDERERLSAELADRYQIEREIGRGGMATVYLARDVKHKRRVAIKVMNPDLASMLGPERFLREIEIEAQLQHINILPLYDSGAASGFLYYVMPYVEGESLRARLNRERQLPLDEALSIVREVGDALNYAHEHGVVHRDVKPENILLSGGHALLADFGIARAVGAAGGQRFTQSGHTLGTPTYMSPEQAAGDSELDGRSDLYSLACVLYEMLAGEPLFTGRTPQALYAKHILETPPPVRILRPAVPSEIELAIDKALAKTPTDRFANTAEFIAALQTPTGAEPTRPSGADEERATVAGRMAEQRERRPGEKRALRPRWMAAMPARLRRGLLAAAALGVIAGLYAVDRWLVDGPELDRSRIVVYPFDVSPRELRTVGEDVATLIGYAFEQTGELTWVDGWYALDEQQRSQTQGLSRRSARSKTRVQGAAFYVVGRVLLPGDSVRVLVELHDIEGDSTVATSAVTGPADEGWEQRECEKAIETLIAAILPSQGQIEHEALSGRPQAVSAFLDGERAFRRARFAEALARYEAAVEADTLFALAALKGARAALWAHKASQAREMLATALSRSELLTPFQAQFARGLDDYVWGRADSALVHLRQAFAVVPEWWVLARIGEVYTHLLPRESPLDSLAESTFLKVRHHDPGFKPVLYHLIEFAVRKGQIRRAENLFRQYQDTDPDSSYLAVAELMLGCVKMSPEQVGWRQAVLSNPSIVYEAAQSLAVAGLQADCASAAWRAILAYEAATTSGGVYQFGTLVGLQSLLVAQGRYDEAKNLLKAALEAAEPTFAASIRDAYLLNTIAGADMRAEASHGVEDLRQRVWAGRYRTGIFPWLVGVWEVHEGRLEEAQTISDSLAALAARTGARRERLLSKSMEARVTLLRGDTTRALTLLQELTPTKPYGTWPRPWESLPAEHLALAELLYARGQYVEALKVAANFDAPARPSTDLIYLPASLSLRIRAARALGDTELEERCRRRLSALGREDLLEPH